MHAKNMDNKTTTNEPTNMEILEAISSFSDRVDERFDKIEGRLDGVEGRLDGVEGKLDGVEGRLNKVEALMVTKDYLDEKMSDLKGDIVVLMRKEDVKLKTLVEILQNKKILSADDAKKILSLEPFPQMYLQ